MPQSLTHPALQRKAAHHSAEAHLLTSEVGAFIGMAFGFLLIAVTRLEQALWFLVVFFVIQQIEGHIVYPKVVGSSVGLPALWTLLAVVVGGKVSGIFGIILFIPLFSVIYALVRRSVYSRLKKKNLKIS